MFLKKLKQFNKRHSDSRLESNKGQVAIIMIFIIAVALIFYAVSLNLGKVSQTKTTVTIASNTSASMLGSLMASYAQSLLETTLGGDDKVCGFTGLLAALLIVIVIVLTIITYGGFAGAAAALFGAGGAGVTALALVSIAAVANLALQAAVIQPGITEMWNKIISNNLSTRNQFLETAVQSGLRAAVTDQAKVPDFTDMDLDGIWQVGASEPYVDTVNRFAVYYTDRLQQITVADTTAILEFQQGLKDFIYKTTTDPLSTEFGLHDPHVCPNPSNPCCYDATLGNPVPSFCNPCCVPDSVVDPTGTTIDIRPDCCYALDETKCGEATQCVANSRYGLASNEAGNPNYPWTYETYSENFSNNLGGAGILSFRELIGRDDDHQYYSKVPPPAQHFWPIQQLPVAAGAESFTVDDVSGYNLNAPYTLSGIFPFFYKAGSLDAASVGTPNLPIHYDWGFNLEQLDSTNPPDVTTRPDTYCFWYDTNFFTAPECSSAVLPEELQTATFPLVLTRDPATLSWNYTPHVDGISASEPAVMSVPGNNIGNPLALDRVRMGNNGSGAGVNAEAADNECAQYSIYKGLGAGLGSHLEGFWKRGSDRFCSNSNSPAPYTGWPYFSCTKHAWGTCFETFDDGETAVAPCECGDPGTVASDWQEDVLDDIVYGIPDFLEFAEGILSDNPQDIQDDIVEWYEDIAGWVEPGYDPGNGITGLPDCYFCDEDEDGFLVIWEKQFTDIAARMEELRAGISFEGSTCTEVWCVPPPGCSEFIPAAEQATFDANVNGVQGDMIDVIACLDWNANDAVTVNISPGLVAPPPPATGPTMGPPQPPVTVNGNAEKFAICRQECSDSACQTLPRSLLPDSEFYPGTLAGGTASLRGYFPITYPADQVIVKQMITCYDGCSDVNCRAMVNAGRDVAGLVAWPAASGNPFDVFDETVDCTVGGDHAPGSPWPQMIQDNLDLIHPSCDLRVADDMSPIDNGWLYNVGLSAIEAENQVAKMKTRKEFLENRLIEVSDIYELFTTASDAFQYFLYDPDGPVRKLIDAVANWDPGGLPYHAIYAWSTYPDNDPTNEPLWHVVRADARLPGRCDTACGVSQDLNSDPAWPKVKTYTKNLGTSRCYQLDNTSGVVKVRIARYDDNPKQNSLLFPNGVPIWDFKTLYPGDDSAFAPNLDTSQLNSPTLCGNLIKDSPHGTTPSEYDGAFMLNKLIKTGASRNQNCWRKMQALLSRGVMTETCVQYYLHKGAGTGMEISFVECKDF